MTSWNESAAAPGIHIERRSLLWLPLFASCTTLLSGAARPGQETPPARAGAASPGAFAPLSWEDFAERWRALALELVGGPAEHDESYAAQLAGLMARVPLDALPRLERPRGSGNGLHAGPSSFLKPCVTVEFRMDPGAVLRLHNHPPQVVVTLCAEGEARYRHLELEGEAPPCTAVGGAFRARETRAGVLAPGRTTALTRLRDGIHGFAAGPRGARIVDFTVATTADIETFSYVDLSDAPVDPDRRVFAGRWTGKG